MMERDPDDPSLIDACTPYVFDQEKDFEEDVMEVVSVENGKEVGWEFVVKTPVKSNNTPVKTPVKTPVDLDKPKEPEKHVLKKLESELKNIVLEKVIEIEDQKDKDPEEDDDNKPKKPNQVGPIGKKPLPISWKNVKDLAVIEAAFNFSDDEEKPKVDTPTKP